MLTNIPESFAASNGLPHQSILEEEFSDPTVTTVRDLIM